MLNVPLRHRTTHKLALGLAVELCYSVTCVAGPTGKATLTDACVVIAMQRYELCRSAQQIGAAILLRLDCSRTTYRSALAAWLTKLCTLHHWSWAEAV